MQESLPHRVRKPKVLGFLFKSNQTYYQVRCRCANCTQGEEHYEFWMERSRFLKYSKQEMDPIRISLLEDSLMNEEQRKEQYHNLFSFLNFEDPDNILENL